MPRTVEEVEQELAEAQAVVSSLSDHCNLLAETLRTTSADLLPFVRRINDAYKQHADFMVEVDKGMKAYVERTNT